MDAGLFLLTFYLYGEILLATIKLFYRNNPWTAVAVFILMGCILLIGLVYSVYVCMIDFKRNKKLKNEVNPINKAFFDVEGGEVDLLQLVGLKVKQQRKVEDQIQMKESVESTIQRK